MGHGTPGVRDTQFFFLFLFSFVRYSRVISIKLFNYVSCHHWQIVVVVDFVVLVDDGTAFEFESVFLIVVHFVLSFSVVLLDTTKEATLEWTRYPYGPQAQTPGVSGFQFFFFFNF